MSKFGPGFIFHPAAGGGTPLITVVPTSLDVTSGVQSYALTGVFLTTDISLSISGPDASIFQISFSSGSGFTTTLTATQSGGNVSTTIYVRLKPLSVVTSGVTYTCSIDNASTGAVTKSVAISYTAP